jgi:outer membrane protein TolC
MRHPPARSASTRRAARAHKAALGIALCGALSFARALAQQAVPVQSLPAASTAASAAPAGEAITLDEAIARARANEPNFAAAVAASRSASLDRSIARAALLPNAVYHNQYLYTQPIHGPSDSANASASSPAISSAPRFIANNTVHEYVSQGQVNETVGAAGFNAVSRASAGVAVADAELELARRGLAAAVANLFYASATANRRIAIAQRAANEAATLTRLTQQREALREVAHADVVKAQLQQQQRDRDLVDARLQAEKAQLDLAVLLFADPRTPYTLTVPETPPAVPARADVEAALAKHNPELESALAGARLADLGVTAARLAYLPDLGLNFTYGIDAAQFAVHAYDGSRNLGYSAYATLDIPVWDWFATHDRVRQSEVRRDVARTTLTNTQRKLIATLEEAYAEATTAHDALGSLEQSADTALQSLRLTRLRYTAGEGTVLEVVDAENSLTSAELAHEDGIVRYQTAIANLQLLTGSL